MMTWKVRTRIEANRRKMDAFFPEHLRPTALKRELLPNAAAYDAALAWWHSSSEDAEPTPPWLYSYGRTGRGKTRAVAAILYELRGDDLELWSASELKSEFAGLCRDVSGLADFRANLVDCDFLILDDWGHTLSESFAENIRLVLERRGDATTVFTSQYSPAAFLQRFKTDTHQAEAIMRRITDSALMIDFGGRRGDQ